MLETEQKEWWGFDKDKRVLRPATAARRWWGFIEATSAAPNSDQGEIRVKGTTVVKEVLARVFGGVLLILQEHVDLI